ncbi:MAG: two-component sensor histidine kinase, partial [Clostridiales bacterium]|nr:two-component sensor histidine kinase [Clostridiales bacterium]
TTNYLRIQELRFPKRFTWSLEAPEELMDYTVPPLIIQTFVENSIKYAFSMSGMIHISAAVSLPEKDSGKLLRIVVRDTGGGFDSKVLERLDAGMTIKDEKGEHIGIWNIKKRLGLLYPGNAGIRLSNDEEGGAVVEIMLPACEEAQDAD